MYQTAGQILLVFLAVTATPTSGGLEKMFENNNKEALIFSIIWSIKTLFTLHLKSVKIEKVFFPLICQISLLVWTVFSVSKRILVLVIYFTPSLGLFNLLHHWQAESLPFSVSQKSRWREGGLQQGQHLQLHNNRSVLWSEIDRWDYSASPSPPAYTLYTGLTLREYFWLFLAVLSLHTVCVGIAKFILVPDFRAAHPVEMFCHCLQNLSLPQPWTPWDTHGGTVRQHRRRFKMEIIEMISIMAVNFVFNALMLGPLLYLGGYLVHMCSDTDWMSLLSDEDLAEARVADHHNWSQSRGDGVIRYFGGAPHLGPPHLPRLLSPGAALLPGLRALGQYSRSRCNI